MTEPGREPRGVDAGTSREQFIRFLTLRLTEELGHLWTRHTDDPSRPGLAAQIEVLDSLLRLLASGHLPDRNDLVMLHAAYRTHPDYDPSWILT